MRLLPEHEEALRRGKEAVLGAFAAVPGTTAFGYGFRRRGGELTDEPVVIASVAKKRPQGYVARSRLLPRTVEVDGRKWGVDVIQAGPYSFGRTGGRTGRPTGDRRGPAAQDATLRKTANQGVGIGNERTDDWGTFGCLVRDLSNGGAPSILTAGHAVGSTHGAVPGDVIVQGTWAGGTGPAIGELTRFTSLRKDGRNLIDAAVVKITDLDNFDEFTTSENQEMPRIGVRHPLIGMLVGMASDYSGLCTRIGPILAEMNVRPYQDLGDPDFPVTCDVIDFDMKVDKAGAGSWYTSSIVVGIGVTPVDLGFLTNHDFYMFDDMVQVDTGFCLHDGDAGAAVCLGGDGRTRIDWTQVNCSFLEGAGEMYDLPLVGDEKLADRFRDDFLLRSRVGRMLVRLFYVNFQALVDRVKGKEASALEKDYAKHLYETYRSVLETVLTTPDTPDRVITSQHVSDAGKVVDGLRPRLSAQEYNAAKQIHALFAQTVGMNRQQLLTMMNGDDLYQKMHTILSRVPTVQYLGPVGADA
ncbi:hypothetical protein [Nonomuraea sp. NPDC049158]|uniref:hypothetical protein n=1 Tax=Nonomuraea sp. NPDC049158 TaxID=3155649 RepID=UPI0033C2DB28